MKDLFSVNIPPAKKRYFAPYARIGNAGDEFYHTINSNSIVYQAKNGENSAIILKCRVFTVQQSSVTATTNAEI